MLVAYDDPTGVTGAFNLNLLGRINRELGGDFQLRGFEHQALWNEDAAPHRNAFALTLESDRVHRRGRSHSRLPRGRNHLDRVLAQIPAGRTRREWRAQTGFQVAGQWIDRDWPFAENLWTVI